MTNGKSNSDTTHRATVWGPLACPNCGYEPGDDTETFTSGGGWERSNSVADGVFSEELSCPVCGETVARDETNKRL
jgi:predicted RNA-binding Zn-ribbon protein involved in translation (DUF1610 family)